MYSIEFIHPSAFAFIPFVHSIQFNQSSIVIARHRASLVVLCMIAHAEHQRSNAFASTPVSSYVTTPRTKPALDGAAARAFDDALERRDVARTSRVSRCHSHAIVIDDVLSSRECHALREASSEAGYDDWKRGDVDASATAATRSARASEDAKSYGYRDAHTVEARSNALARELWRRLSAYVPEIEHIDDEHPLNAPGVSGTWRAIGVNADALFAKYTEGGHFSPHTDGATVVDFNTRSLYSVLIYLNDCDDGGETVMYAPPVGAERNLFVKDDRERYRWPKEWIADVVKCVAGNALVFRQEIPHEGAPVGRGRVKTLLRTDVMYERCEPLFTDALGLEAYALHQRAMELESSGDAMGAMRLFRHCRRLCPAYAEVVGIS